MKTKYFIDLQLRDWLGQANPYSLILDTQNINLFAGLLSALPDNFNGGAGDNWTGARELFCTPDNPYIAPITGEAFPGIKRIGVPSFGYQPRDFRKGDISEPTVTYNRLLDSSGLTIEFPLNGDLIFPAANGADWGTIVGIVIYGSVIQVIQRPPPQQPDVRVTLLPLLVTDLISPVTIRDGQIFKLSNLPQNRVKFTELMRKLPLR